MTRFTYIYDTYCGWCYGAAPVINALIECGADVTVMHRHLFQGANAYRMGDGFGRMALEYDRRIERLTGQEFSPAYVQDIIRNPDEVLDSGLTAYAAALVHDQRAMAEMKLAQILQRARYVDGVSAGNSEAVRSALLEFGVNRPLDEGRNHARQISTNAANLQSRVGSQGVPTLVMQTDGGTTQVDVSTYYNFPEEIAALAA
ncbi:DsbA family protein [Phaeobacter gallaeciensis]|uniref:DsbA family protein n=1 Tax=Phaeobacter gallaeciensis TaxID=60890 RepID=A0AAC9Z924_9RHOB|nr:putative protein-disulfide isomerase [Phaeobacter gallaeciensis]AHD08831.1 putative protein-disulfide isomerase [Phaeobacter gallaeciensis DSM 26640]ATE92097.1 putative protein-disulfide isomerase [Phaeobacter gallaeciensis]ATE98079.1 putative protein-disulfide isomerase [Phaeobacter gallaeciensis]ATF00713.1 putative protein-disulfide isomerase [Phaeobacter gallaeciensis]ATF05144.1 putative protein-disulfide isomerase [Phaeobacter gallaeciensis]